MRYESEQRWVVMRYPVLMEDEGRHHFVKSFPSHIEAQEWVKKQLGEYFVPEDYYILGPETK